MAHEITWILADAHGGHDAHADAELLELLEQARTQSVDLLILGDLFLVWLAPEKFWSDFQRRVVAALAELRRTGRSVRFVIGNREFLLEDGGLEHVFDRVYAEECLIDICGTPTWVAHGDRVNRSDWRYALWRRLTRSAPSRALMRQLPGRLGRGLSQAVERAMAQGHASSKYGSLPLAELEALSQRARRAGAARAILGHFHRDETIEFAGGVPVVLAPAWLEHRRFLVADAKGGLEARDLDALRPRITPEPDV